MTDRGTDRQTDLLYLAQRSAWQAMLTRCKDTGKVSATTICSEKKWVSFMFEQKNG